MHHLDGLDRVESLGGLAAQHDAVGAVEDGVGDVGRLGASRSRLAAHALEHLRRADDRLAGQVAATNHHLLRQEHLHGQTRQSVQQLDEYGRY